MEITFLASVLSALLGGIFIIISMRRNQHAYSRRFSLLGQWRIFFMCNYARAAIALLVVAYVLLFIMIAKTGG